MERTIAFIALFTALIAALGYVPAVTLTSGVPITAQTLGVMLAGCVLGSWRAFLSIMLFLVLTALGVPLLAGGRGGLGVFFSPSVGYLIGWPIGAFIIGYLVQQLRFLKPFGRGLIAALIGGVLFIHLTGVLGLAFMLKTMVFEAFLLTLPFVPGDLIKVFLAAVIYWMLCTYRPNSLF